jgi:hypothetical protein
MYETNITLGECSCPEWHKTMRMCKHQYLLWLLHDSNLPFFMRLEPHTPVGLAVPARIRCAVETAEARARKREEDLRGKKLRTGYCPPALVIVSPSPP